MKIISIGNIKGGVGKSSTAATMAAGLSERGYRILLIDADPQTNLSMCFLPEQPDETLSLYHVFSENKKIEDVKISLKDNLDILPGDFALCNADMQFVRAGRLRMLGRALKEVEDTYDMVIIDTPPNMGILSLNAFMASDYIIVPMSADSFSLKGVRLLKEVLDDVREEKSTDLTVAGLLLTKYNKRTNVSKLLENSINSAANLLDTKVFESRIRQAVVVQESQIAKEDLFTYSPNAPVTDDYRKVIDEILIRIGV